jgi:thiol-disulfide isomerase/thioredoxin
MTNKLTKGLEVSANVAIIVVAVLLCVVLVRQQLLGSAQPGAGASRPGAAANLGAKLTLPGVDWAESKKTLVLALSSGCHFCSESAPFYQRLVKEGGVRLIAVVPQDAAEGRAYLDRLSVPIGDVRQTPLGAIGVEGTPTLMLVDDKGVTLNSWVGKLPAGTEDEVLSKIG